MDTIFIDELVFAGRHGVNPEERTTSQRFSISVRMEVDTRKAAESDSLVDTVNYKAVRDLIRSIVEGEHTYLIEKIGHTIATAILADTRVVACAVTIAKPDVWGNGTPGVVIARSQTH